MELFVDDAGFVRAPAGLTYRRLEDVATWPAWWPGLRVHPMDALAHRYALELAGAPLRRLRLEARAYGWRRDKGVELDLGGDVVGRAEFWLEPGYDGTVVHHILDARTSLRRPAVVLEDYRRALRRGLFGLKDLLQLEARTSAGLDP